MYFLITLSSQGHFEFFTKHFLCLCCTQNTLNYSLKKNCSKNSFFPDDIITTSSYKLKYIIQYLATAWEKKYFSLFLRGLMSSQGGTLKFLYILRLGLFFWVQNFESQYDFWGFKKKIFLGVWRFCGYFFGVSPQNWPIFRGSFLCILGSFLKGKVQNGGYFWGS